MGKSGQRLAYTAIIDRQELRTPARRLMESSVTAVLWAMWMYWILPVITVMLWGIGIKMFERTFFDPEQFRQLCQVLSGGGIGILVIFGINLLWIYYNYHFIHRRKGTRRKTSPPNNDHVLAAFYRIDEDTLVNAKQHNRFEMELDNGHITICCATTTVKDTSRIKPLH